MRRVIARLRRSLIRYGVFTLLGLIATWALSGCLDQQAGATPSVQAANGNVYEDASQPQRAKVDVPRQREVKQDPGKVVYWVMPGPRQLSPDVFGTPKAPKMLLKPKLEAAEQAVAARKAPPALPDTLKKLPILVGVPLKARHQHADGSWWLDAPTPFGDQGRIIQGSFTAHYWDYVTVNPPGPPPKTPDKAEMEAEFTDPQGHHYRVVLKKVLKPPFPGYHTQGGVMIDSYHHGLTGTGTPLMPKVKTYAAFWGMGDVYIDGQRADENVVMHMMTTEVVRDRNYHLARNDEMPLPPAQWLVKGQSHHTHLIVLPVKAVHGQGPVFQPLKTAFKLPNGKTQPFMHIMFEEDEIGPVTALETSRSKKPTY
jgi:hypothetical protein